MADAGEVGGIAQELLPVYIHDILRGAVVVPDTQPQAALRALVFEHRAGIANIPNAPDGRGQPVHNGPLDGQKLSGGACSLFAQARLLLAGLDAQARADLEADPEILEDVGRTGAGLG